ncbi:hypothetical protein [Microcoleus sp. herbarium12]
MIPSPGRLRNLQLFFRRRDRTSTIASREPPRQPVEFSALV